jgi:DNA-binding NarL/FixJ family response regulator
VARWVVRVPKQEICYFVACTHGFLHTNSDAFDVERSQHRQTQTATVSRVTIPSGLVAAPQLTGVLVADSNHIHCQLLVGALRRRPEFHVLACAMDLNSILSAIGDDTFDVVLMHAERDLPTIRSLHLTHPEIAKVLLLDTSGRDTVLNAFRSGARGLFSFSDSPFRLLCKCIQCVHRGEIWASNEHLEYLVEAVTQVPSLRLVNSRGINLLTPREEQVVALVADGLINRDVARELGLSEHTVKKYLFRIFDKLGVSTRVELVLYAVTRGAARQAEWIPS